MASARFGGRDALLALGCSKERHQILDVLLGCCVEDAAVKGYHFQCDAQHVGGESGLPFWTGSAATARFSWMPPIAHAEMARSRAIKTWMTRAMMGIVEVD